MSFDPVLADTSRYYRDLDDADKREARIQTRETEIWHDLEILSELTVSLDCLEVRGARRGSYELKGVTHTYSHPAVTTGKPAMLALRERDFTEFGRIVYAELAEKVRQRAEDDVEDERDES